MASKLSRTVLKGIVKECLVEIMEEAFFPHTNSQMQEKLNESRSRGNFNSVSNKQFTSTKQTSSDTADARSRHLDVISYGRKTAETPVENKNFESRVSQVTESMTSDPVLANILKDTALTTLQEQASAESSKGRSMPVSQGDQAARAASARVLPLLSKGGHDGRLLRRLLH